MSSPGPARPVCVVSIVDDDAAVREALSSLLRSVGREVRTFASASEFLAAPRPPAPAGAARCLRPRAEA